MIKFASEYGVKYFSLRDACNPSYMGGRNEKIIVFSQPEQMLG
jgi:hypothetical protein